MEKNFLRAFISKGASEGSAGDPIRFVASTTGIKRDGMDLKAEDWFLDNFRKNPVFLWAHDYWGNKLPLGRVEAEVEGQQLMATVWFDQEDEFARAVENKYRKGFLHTVSVGWNFIEIEKRRVMDLLDVSGVPVPGDPDALVVRQYEALKELVEKKVDTGGSEPTEDAWESTAAAMVDVLLGASDDDAERERRYKALLPKYRRLGKVAPEFRTIEELAALEEEDLVNLFLEGEEIRTADGSWLMAHGEDQDQKSRAGAVLSKRNMSDLEAAIALIQGVMERAKPETGPGDGAGEDPDPEKEGQRKEKDAEQDEIDPILMRTLEIQKYILFGGQNG